jgi:hypothetical protein
LITLPPKVHIVDAADDVINRSIYVVDDYEVPSTRTTTAAEDQPHTSATVARSTKVKTLDADSRDALGTSKPPTAENEPMNYKSRDMICTGLAKTWKLFNLKGGCQYGSRLLTIAKVARELDAHTRMLGL